MRACLLWFVLALAARAADPVTLTLDRWTARIEPDTLTVRAVIGGRSITVAAGAANPAVPLERTQSRASWRIPALAAAFHFEARGGRLHVRVESEREQTLQWPRTGEDPQFDALILPEKEGLYVPVADPAWLARLNGECFSAHGQLSMPFWSYRFPGATFTWQLLSDVRAEVCAASRNGRLAVTSSNRFVRGDGPLAYELELWPGGASPIAPALEYREWLMRSGQYVSLTEKIRANSAVERLLGAVHMYVWGDGRTPEFIADLRRAGIRRALINFDQNETADGHVAGKAFIDAAKAAGYLAGPYDTYANAQPPAKADDPVAVWPGDLYPAGCIVKPDGEIRRGFNGRGCELSSEALEKVEPVSGVLAARLASRLKSGSNAYFLDVDAFGELYDDHAPAHSMSKAKDRENRIRRMQRIRERGVVLGSEEGVGWSVPFIDYAHGAHSVQNGVLWAKRKEMGRWWPPHQPGVFFQRIDLGPDFAAAKYDPAYRLPLYQAAFHGAVVATERWDVPLMKFPTLAARRQLLELLYGVPSIWAMNRREWTNTRQRFTSLAQFFEPLHREIGAAHLESFEWLTADRLVQRTVFSGGWELTANFGSAGFAEVKPGCIVARRGAQGEARTFCPQTAPAPR